MPELPEVETTRRGLAPLLEGRRILAVRVHDRRLRWPLPRGFEAALAGRRVRGVGRRAKYLLVETDGGTLLVHLGMSGSLRAADPATPRRPHDHVEIELDSGRCLRFNDPRRFGSMHVVDGDPLRHPLLRALGPEPLSAAFDAAYLHARTRGRRVAIKPLLMNASIVVGVGNIYASEALFHAGVAPGRAAGRLTRAEAARVVAAVRRVLESAIRAGGTTLRDYVNTDGDPGYFRQKLYVYERAGEPCRQCATPVRQRVQGQRSTYWCPTCQR
jgi:formamidopyrimidine-DNA glycosylase